MSIAKDTPEITMSNGIIRCQRDARTKTRNFDIIAEIKLELKTC
jgi:hypothetical protein